MSASAKRPFSRDQRTIIVHGMLVFVLIVVILQLVAADRHHERVARRGRFGGVAGGGGERLRLRAERRPARVPGPARADAPARGVTGMASTLQPGELLALDTLVTPTAQGIASRVLARTAAGNITLFAFERG